MTATPDVPNITAAARSRAIKRALWRLSFEKRPAADNPGDCRWRLSSSAVRIIEQAVTAAIDAEGAAHG